MNKMLAKLPTDYWRNLLVFAITALMILTSCPIKSNIKKQAGIPANTEQGAAKNQQALAANGTSICSYTEQTGSKISQSFSLSKGGLLPIVLFAVTFAFLFGCTALKVQPHPFYTTLKVNGTLPIFLQYRKLII